MPDSWKNTTIGAIAEIVGGGTPSTKEPTYWGGDVVWLTPTEVVRQDGGVISSSERKITLEGLRGSSAKLLPAGAVLLTSRASVGFTAIAGCELSTNQGFQSLIPSAGILPEFLRLWIQSNRDEFTSRAGGSTFPEISKAKVATIPIILPPLDVQRRIVAAVGGLDSVLGSLDSELASARSLLRTLRETLLAGWPLAPLAEVCHISASLVDPRASEYSALPYFGIDRMGKASGELLAESDEIAPPISGKYLFGPNDVVYSKIRPNLRKVVWPGFEGLCSADAYPLTPVPEVPSALLRECLLSDEFSKVVTSMSGRTKMPKVNRKELFQTKIRMGETPAERAEASALLEAARALVRALSAEVVTLRVLRGQLVTGLLDGSIALPESDDAIAREVA